jgi:hypothetical protein
VQYGEESKDAIVDDAVGEYGPSIFVLYVIVEALGREWKFRVNNLIADTQPA